MKKDKLGVILIGIIYVYSNAQTMFQRLLSLSSL
jgi:hypothetical protein